MPNFLLMKDLIKLFFARDATNFGLFDDKATL
jgi:hypothetical protein